jgi:hypothetical protein
MSEDITMRLPSTKKLKKIRAKFGEDDWFFPRIRLGKKPKFEVPVHGGDEDDVETVKRFYCVVLVAKKNFFLSDEDKEKGKEPKEKRALYLLRDTMVMPELYYVSPTGLLNWKKFVKPLVDDDQKYFEVLCEVTAEAVNNSKNGYSWSKPVFTAIRPLTEEELAHVDIMRELVNGRVKDYEENSELDAAEEKALAVDKKKPVDPLDDDDDDDDEEDTKKSSKKSKTKDDDDDDEDDKKSKKSKSKSKAKDEDDDDDDDEEDTKKSKAKSKKSKDEDDDDDDEDDKKSKAKSKKSKDEDDDDDEEDTKKSKSKSKSKKKKSDDDDDDEDDGKKSKGRAGYPDLSEDDDDDDL